MGDSNAIFLHGDMQVSIIHAHNLPSAFRMSLPNPLVPCSCTSITQIDDHSTFAHDPSTSDVHRPNKRSSKGTYVVLYINGVRLVRTRVVPTGTNPTWNQRFNFPLAHLASQMEFYVKDNHLLLPKIIGVATVPVGIITGGGVIHHSFGVIGRHTSNECTLQLRISFTPCHINPIYQNGFSESYAVAQSYFPLHRGGKLSLYQDAHTMDGGLPEIKLDGSASFEHGKCWEEISHAMMDAQHLIYIVGWSFYHKIKLVRETTSSSDEHDLGEFLKMKSGQGVRVAVLIWNDKTSYDEFFGKLGAGLMRTHDKETRKFFKDSSVVCLLAPRYTNSTFSNFKEQTLRALYTQHQKCVIVDSQGEGNTRKLTAYLGGLDLCDGRYDTPEHRLFRDRRTVFKDDFHNPSLDPAKQRNGPRQPWHDLHCKVEGPAAYDLLTNFEQRWRRASEWSAAGRWFKRTSGWVDNTLLDIQNIPFIISPSATIPHDIDPSLWVSNQDDPPNWHTQVFRSIDSGSLTGFPEDAQEAYEQNLVCDKIFVIDRSIEMAYIQAIRSAQHFIYIENQYFIGSSYAWTSNQNAGANNLIPMELALKIASKIRAGERFAVYIIIPMWPEGEAYSRVVQEILYWQRRTMQMMYQMVARELHSSQLATAHPTDYLNFYCLGNREEFHEEEGSTSGSPTSDQTLDRFMVYVHSKGMIVDDKYVIIGSANINQRSLAGSRDTEIAVGAYQPHYSRYNDEHPCGQVYGYRMSLWAEHTGVIEDCFKAPENLECVRYVNSIAETNWQRYTAEEFTLLQGHILKYPVQVDSDGQLTPLPGFEIFPDVGGLVEGVPSRRLPHKLTT